MKITELLQKVTKGESLTDEEKKFLADYNPEADESRIPKARLDAESTKRKEAESRADGLQAKLDELNEKLENLENAGKTENERQKIEADKAIKKMQAELEKLKQERDTATTELATARRSAKIAEIAAKYKFSDATYLDYLAGKEKIDLDDDGAVTTYMGGLAKSLPQMFASQARSGGGTAGGSSNAGGADDAKARIDALLAKPSLSSREAAEVIGLREKMNAGGNAASNTGKQQGV